MKVLLAVPHVFAPLLVSLFIPNGSQAKSQAEGTSQNDDRQSQQTPEAALDSCLTGATNLW